MYEKIISFGRLLKLLLFSTIKFVCKNDPNRNIYIEIIIQYLTLLSYVSFVALTTGLLTKIFIL